jgi:UDP-N-acetylmuramoylalanine--D-glutamate ligase
LAARLNGAKPEAINAVIEGFRGLEHRLEFVARKNAVNFFNDSKATNVDSLIRALAAFKDNVILIAGGRAKSSEFTPIIPHIRGRIKNIILYGEAKEALNRAIGDECETFLVGTFEEAVLLAYQKSRGGDTVLLSPGCSSLDMFENFAERGNYFKQLIGQF